MKTMCNLSFNLRTKFLLSLIFIVFALFSSCQKEAPMIDEASIPAPLMIAVPCTTPTPTPGTGPGGNGECPAGYDNTCEFNVDQSLPFPQSGHCGAPAPYGVDWTISADGEVCWNGEYVCGITLVVKGGPASNIYTYGTDCNEDCGLFSPVNNGGQVPQVSNMKICWNECVPLVCNDETAFGGNSAGAGNAWWFYFNTNGPACQTIWAGQTQNAGEVCYDGSGFTITLASGWELDPDTDESVKAQGYNVLPTNRPAAGLFTLYKGTSLSFNGNGSTYYVIHLDLTYCE